MNILEALKAIKITPLVKRLLKKFKAANRRLEQRSCPHTFIGVYGWEGQRQFCTRCHLTKDFQPWA